MDAQKTHTEEKKILLYELQLIIKKLYPHTKTINPYQATIDQYLNRYDVKEYLLYQELLHAITILNQRGRLKEHKKVISSQTDVINTLELLQIIPVDQQSMESYNVLYKRYKTTLFTSLSAGRTLKKSRTTVYRHFKSLQALGLLEKTDQKQDSKPLYRLLENLYAEVKKENIYQEAMGEWSDFIGFVEF
ncbi:hypothetical protein AWE51_25780 [Aquimarina aggregata]|uniref:Uncharacterized protein n=1 Tax=Aquimarina aggregata TaxID=1642818 RepID=A0A162CMQ8_9FLAO|nr:hypothetical protein [Aquimarina aggregata]KZS39504.1 hypothetical protein AWE51_25780 [Aquimarina aggregata]